VGRTLWSHEGRIRLEIEDNSKKFFKLSFVPVKSGSFFVILTLLFFCLFTSRNCSFLASPRKEPKKETPVNVLSRTRSFMLNDQKSRYISGPLERALIVFRGIHSLRS
jgi:hypothetical protein